MLRGATRLLARSSPSSQAAPSLLRRHVSSTAPYTTAPSVAALITSAAAANPLKDAAKFYGTSSAMSAEAALPADSGLPSKGISLWTFSDLSSHTRALATGLSEAGLVPGDKLLVCLPPQTQEYVSLVLAAADSGITLVALAPPDAPAAADVDPIVEALKKYAPRGVVLWHGYRASGKGLVEALFPDAGMRDARGLAGLGKLTGLPLESDFPGLDYVVHTSDAHIRGAVSFKSLLVYSGAETKGGAEAKSGAGGDRTVLVEAGSGREVSHSALLEDARKLGKKLDLVSDVYARNGKVVLRPMASVEAAAGAVSALMHESLLINTSVDDATATAKVENALVV